MKNCVVLDTGPLVAFLNRHDAWHAWVMERMADFEPPLLTCEAAISEACFLLRRSPGGAVAVLEMLERGVLKVALRLADEAPHIKRLLQRYSDVPMSAADAGLVRIAELAEGSRVLTLDSDFRRYRRHGRQVIPLIIPDGR